MILKAADEIATYRVILELSQQMKALAIKGEWDALPEVEKERSVEIEKLGASNIENILSAQDVDEKSRLINEIIQCDTETKHLIQAWMNELSEILGSCDMARRLDSAYAGME